MLSATVAFTPTLALSFAGELIEFAIIAAILALVASWIATALPTDSDREWLTSLVMWGFSAKVIGSFLRYFMAIDLYGTGDAFRYHNRGVAFADIWRNLAIPISDAGGQGTAFTEEITGLVYSLYTPSMRGGFLLFAFIAFLGQLLFYSAFRHWLRGKALKRYAIFILFFPSLVFWPASIGKDSLMMLFIGLTALGISRLMRRFEMPGLLLVVLGLYLTAQVRPHIALMLVLAAALTLLFVKRRQRREAGSPSRGTARLVLLVAAVVGLTFAWGAFADDFQVSLEGGGDTTDPIAFLDRVSNQTAQGGSEVTGGVVNGPQDLPAATLKVLFRPLIYEVTNTATLMSALEGSVLLVLVVWKLPAMWRNRAMLRPNPLLLFSFIYTGGFVVAFSSVLNLGILARQRVQVLPFFLALVVALGWPQDNDEAVHEPKTPSLAGARPR